MKMNNQQIWNLFLRRFRIRVNQAKYVLGLLAVLFFITSAAAQSSERKVKYQIRVWGMNIGEFTVSQKTEGEDISIEAITDVEVKMIFTYRVKYIQQSLYRHETLWSSHVETLKNGKINSDTRLEKQGENYLLTQDGDSALIHDNITYSGSLLYFHEPVQIKDIYKERTGEKNSFRSIDDHTYAMVDEKDNKTNVYEYKNGVLVRAELIHSLATIQMILSP